MLLKQETFKLLKYEIQMIFNFLFYFMKYLKNFFYKENLSSLSNI